jgi:hypothetical protein
MEAVVSEQRFIPIRVRGQVVGEVRGIIFRKVLNSQKHFLRKPPAIALDLKSVEDARRAGADRVAIRDEKGNWFVALFELLFLRGWKFNMAHGDQIALCMKWWQPCIREAEALLAQEKGAEAAKQDEERQAALAPVQEALFV